MWDKIRFVFGMLTIGMILGLTMIAAGIEIKDYDLWLHIATGRFISHNLTVPAVDFLSCTVQGLPWNNHEWLFQVLIANIFDQWGPEGLVLMQMAIALLAMTILVIVGFSKKELFLTSFFLLLTQIVFAGRFTHRPDLFSLLFFAIYIFVLSRHIDKRWSLPLLFLAQVVWTNMHGFFFFGPLLIILGIFSEWIKRNIKLPYEWNSIGRLTDNEFDRLGKIFFALLLACLFNPQFISGAVYPLTIFLSLGGDNKIFFDSILELQKPMVWGTIMDTEDFPHYKLLIFISGLSFFFNRRKLDISAFLLWLVFLLFSLQAIRNLSYFAFAAFFVLQTNVINIDWKNIIPLRFIEKKFESITLTFLNILLLIWILGYVTDFVKMKYYDHDNYRIKSEFGGVSLRNHPVKAVEFLVKNKVKGNFFNDFNSGAYLLGNCFPDIKVYIDGRTELYGAEFFKNYQQIWKGTGQELFEQQVKRYAISGALLSSVKHHVPAKLLNYFYNSKDWALVYFDYDGLIFLKDIPQNAEMISKYRIDLLSWKPESADIYRYGTDYVSGYRQYYRAYTLESLNFDDKAMEEINTALLIDPYYSDAYQLKGKIYTKRGDYEGAFHSFRTAALIQPHREEILYNLALAYTDLKRHEGAVKLYGLIFDNTPSPKAAFLLTKAQIKNGKYADAQRTLEIARKMAPESIGDIIGIADSLVEAGQLVEAEKIYLNIVEAVDKKQKFQMLQKLGDLYIKLERRKDAQSVYIQASELEPGNQILESKLHLLEKLD